MTTQQPTFEQLVSFVKDNDLNVFNQPNPVTCDNEEIVFDAVTYTEENFDELVDMWQAATPASREEKIITVNAMIDRAIALVKYYKQTNKQVEFWGMCSVQLRLMQYKLHL